MRNPKPATRPPYAVCLVPLFLVAVPVATNAREWGHLTGRFVYGGESAPERPKLELNKDVDYCGPFDPRDEGLVVDPKSKGVANVIVWLDEAKSDREVTVHDSYEKQADEPVTVNNRKCRFEPHVQTMRSGQTLKVANGDEIAHAAAFFLLNNDPYACTVVPNGSDERTIAKAETLPVQITCPIHAWMKGWLVVKDHPYVAVSGTDGTFRIANLPAGEWTFRVWHESVGYVDEVTAGGEETRWRSGRFTITVPAGGTKDLKDLVIDAGEFEVD